MKVNCPKCKRRVRIRKSKRDVKCPCGFEFSHRKFFGDADRYLIDTNIFLYAINRDQYYGDYCRQLLSCVGELVTTNHVIDEIKQFCEFKVKVYEIDEISPEVAELRYGDERYELSIADRSLIQCAIDYPEIGGIITYDADIKSVVPSRLIKTDKPFFIGTADAFLKKRGRR
jgi:predicted nucleic acid-binding protein